MYTGRGITSRASETARPVEMSRCPCRSLAGVIRFSVPGWSAFPPPPQFFRSLKSPLARRGAGEVTGRGTVVSTDDDVLGGEDGAAVAGRDEVGLVRPRPGVFGGGGRLSHGVRRVEPGDREAIEERRPARIGLGQGVALHVAA